jgi:hypothetical protein
MRNVPQRSDAAPTELCSRDRVRALRHLFATELRSVFAKVGIDLSGGVDRRRRVGLHRHFGSQRRHRARAVLHFRRNLPGASGPRIDHPSSLTSESAALIAAPSASPTELIALREANRSAFPPAWPPCSRSMRSPAHWCSTSTGSKKSSCPKLRCDRGSARARSIFVTHHVGADLPALRRRRSA